MQISYQFDFLRHAILCVAARHLSILQSSNVSYQTTAAAHMGRAVSGIRHRVLNDFHGTHVDAFIGTSILLKIEVWANPDYFSPQPMGSSAKATQDPLFSFCSTMKQVFLESVPQMLNQTSFLKPFMSQDATDTLVKAANIDSNTPAKHFGFFDYYKALDKETFDKPLEYTRGNGLAISIPWHHLSDPRVKDKPDAVLDGYMPAVTRLCLISAFLPEANPPISVAEDPSVRRAMARYIMTFPVVCFGSFTSMVEQGDPHAIYIVYRFYQAVKRLLPADECWWGQKRSIAMEESLKTWLMERGFVDAGVRPGAFPIREKEKHTQW